MTDPEQPRCLECGTTENVEIGPMLCTTCIEDDVRPDVVAKHIEWKRQDVEESVGGVDNDNR